MTVTSVATPHPRPQPRKVGGGLLDPRQLWKSLPDALRKLNPATLWRTPVMLIVEVGAVFTTLLAIAFLALPYTDFRGEAYRLVVKLLWLQAVTAPCYGLSMVVSSVLQAARRYDFLPRFEMAVVILRFVVLMGGLAAGIDFFLIVVAQTALSVGLSLGPALWVMVRELGFVPHLLGARRADFAKPGRQDDQSANAQLAALAN